MKFKVGMKIRTKKHNRNWSVGYLNQAGVITEIKTKLSSDTWRRPSIWISVLGNEFPVYPEEIEILGPPKPPPISYWK